VVGLVEHHGGGILALFNILKEHWGAVERDLQAHQYTLDDVITDRMPLSGFVHFVVYSPPGTAIFHVLNEGWTADTYQLTSLLDVASTLLWSKTKDAQEKLPQHRPKPFPRPGTPVEPLVQEPEMTVGDYLKIIEGGSDGVDS
jgi:hypothetical protein